MQTELPRYQWPHNKTSAVWITVDVDAYSPLLWRNRHEPEMRFIAEFEQRQHGLRAGLYHLLDLFARHQLRITFFVPALIAERHPELIPNLARHHHEIGLHGYCHEAVRDITDEEFTKALEQSIKILTEQAGKLPKGFRSPGWEMTRHMLAELKRHKLYDSSLAGLDHPYTIEGITELPILWTREDTSRFKMTGLADRWPPSNPEAVLKEWIYDWRATAEQGGLFTLTLHDWIAGRPVQLSILDEFLNEVSKDQSVWITTGVEVDKHHTNQ